MQLCQPVLRRPVRAFFAHCTLKIYSEDHDLRMTTSASQRAGGKTVRSDLKSGSKGGTHQARSKSTSRVVGAVHLRKSTVHIVRNMAQKPCLSLCTRSASIATKNKTLHDGAGTSNDGIGQFRQTLVHTRYSCNFARTIRAALTSTFPLWGDGRNRAQSFIMLWSWS